MYSYYNPDSKPKLNEVYSFKPNVPNSTYPTWHEFKVVEQAGYHKTVIIKGVFGELSKIEEEVAELKDSIEQGNKIMALCELSDLYGAIRGLLHKQYNGLVTMKDLETMADATKRAFDSGHRKSADKD